MFQILVKHGEQTILREHFANPFEAEDRFTAISQERHDGPSAVFLTNGPIIKKQYRLDADWPGERSLQNDSVI